MWSRAFRVLNVKRGMVAEMVDSQVKKCEVCGDLMSHWRITNEYGDTTEVWVCGTCRRRLNYKNQEMRPEEVK